ncbi:hypothetical protein, partial [Bradyrhizobium sp.]
MLLLLAAGIGMAPLAHAQALPAEQDDREAAAETAASDTDSEGADSEDLEPDWSQLNTDTATLLLGPAAKARAPKASDGSDTS